MNTGTSKLSKIMDEFERRMGLFCTPPHITAALLTREKFPETVWEPAAGKGDIVRVLVGWGYHVVASDIHDWGLRPCKIEDFLTSTTQADAIITNPLFPLKWKFLAQAKRLARFKIAMLLPLDTEYRTHFIHHQSDTDFAWKALYAFTQGVPWLNVTKTWGRMLVGWHVFERGYRGPVLRQKIAFDRVR
ncbi:MAG: hypothetical protein GXY83_34195 [Rhodopirellula sp.]|nr:hypothetical protein [Rhodopirellula sp.]